MQTPRPLDRLAIRRAQFLDAEQRDDFLQLAVMGDRFAHVLRGAVMRLADQTRIEQARRRGAADRPRDTCPRPPCRATARSRQSRWLEDRGHRRIGEIVGRHVNRLDRGDRGAGDRGDALLQLGDFGGERRLIADPRRQAAEQAGDLAARLHEAIDVVDQQQHVLVRAVAEIFGDGERGQAGAPARARRLRSSGRTPARCAPARRTAAVPATARGLRASARRCRQTPRCPACFSTVVRISSMISTVLPTPAPPNIAALPPVTKGANRSMTLMPVWKICWPAPSRSRAGAGAWIGR